MSRCHYNWRLLWLQVGLQPQQLVQSAKSIHPRVRNWGALWLARALGLPHGHSSFRRALCRWIAGDVAAVIRQARGAGAISTTCHVRTEILRVRRSRPGCRAGAVRRRRMAHQHHQGRRQRGDRLLQDPRNSSGRHPLTGHPWLSPTSNECTLCISQDLRMVCAMFSRPVESLQAGTPQLTRAPNSVFTRASCRRSADAPLVGTPPGQ